MMHVHIKQSKTDTFQVGTHIYLGRTYQHICLVKTILSYLAVWGSNPGSLVFIHPLYWQGAYQGYIWFWTWPNPNEAWLTNFPLQYTHSFRIGAATPAKHAGISDVHIKTLAQWKSDAYQWHHIRIHLNNWSIYQGYCYLRHWNISIHKIWWILHKHGCQLLLVQKK